MTTFEKLVEQTWGSLQTLAQWHASSLHGWIEPDGSFYQTDIHNKWARQYVLDQSLGEDDLHPDDAEELLLSRGWAATSPDGVFGGLNQEQFDKFQDLVQQHKDSPLLADPLFFDIQQGQWKVPMGVFLSSSGPMDMVENPATIRESTTDGFEKLVEGQLTEGTWSLPFTEEQALQLRELMQQPLTPAKAKEVLYGLYGNDSLFDQLDGLLEKEPDGDVRSVVRAHLVRLLHEWIWHPEDFKDHPDKKVWDILDPVLKESFSEKLVEGNLIEAGVQPVVGYHGTSAFLLPEIMAHGLRDPYIARDEDVAYDYATFAGQEPVVIQVVVDNPEHLRYDRPEMTEPHLLSDEELARVFDKIATEHPEWVDADGYVSVPDKAWQVSWKYAGAARYRGTIPPQSLKLSETVEKTPDGKFLVKHKGKTWGPFEDEVSARMEDMFQVNDGSPPKPGDLVAPLDGSPFYRVPGTESMFNEAQLGQDSGWLLPDDTFVPIRDGESHAVVAMQWIEDNMPDEELTPGKMELDALDIADRDGWIRFADSHNFELPAVSDELFAHAKWYSLRLGSLKQRTPFYVDVDEPSVLGVSSYVVSHNDFRAANSISDLGLPMRTGGTPSWRATGRSVESFESMISEASDTKQDRDADKMLAQYQTEPTNLWLYTDMPVKDRVAWAYLAADEMKEAPGGEDMLERFVASLKEVVQDTDTFWEQIEKKDKKRAEYLADADWTIEEVPLTDVGVYPKFSGYPDEACKGDVKETAEWLRHTPEQPLKRKKLLTMADRWMTILHFLPPILVPGGTLRGRHEDYKETKYDIDDGNHRAVAAALDGAESIIAFVGKPKGATKTEEESFESMIEGERTYLNIGHYPPDSAAAQQVVPFWMSYKSDDVAYGNAGQTHEELDIDWTNAEVIGRIDHNKKAITIASGRGRFGEPAPERMQYVASVLKTDYPEYKIHHFTRSGYPLPKTFESMIEAWYGSKKARMAPEGVTVELFKNPNSRELRDATFNGQTRAYAMPSGDLFVWNPADEYHRNMVREFPELGEGIPVYMFMDQKAGRADVRVTDAARNTKWFHNPETAGVLRSHAWLSRRFPNGVFVDYFDDAIVGDWENLEPKEPRSFESMIESSLTEGRVTDAQIKSLIKLVKQANASMGKPGVPETYYQDVVDPEDGPENLKAWIEEVDPHPRKAFGSWIAREWRKQLAHEKKTGVPQTHPDFIVLEDAGQRGQLHAELTKFMKAKARKMLKGKQADINSYDYQSFYNAMAEIEEAALATKADLAKSREEIQSLGRIAFEQGSWLIVAPAGPDELTALADKGGWCVKEKSYADLYMRHDEPVYIMFSRKRTKPYKTSPFLGYNFAAAMTYDAPPAVPSYDGFEWEDALNQSVDHEWLGDNDPKGAILDFVTSHADEPVKVEEWLEGRTADVEEEPEEEPEEEEQNPYENDELAATITEAHFDDVEEQWSRILRARAAEFEGDLSPDDVYSFQAAVKKIAGTDEEYADQGFFERHAQVEFEQDVTGAWHAKSNWEQVVDTVDMESLWLAGDPEGYRVFQQHGKAAKEFDVRQQMRLFQQAGEFKPGDAVRVAGPGGWKYGKISSDPANREKISTYDDPGAARGPTFIWVEFDDGHFGWAALKDTEPAYEVVAGAPEFESLPSFADLVEAGRTTAAPVTYLHVGHLDPMAQAWWVYRDKNDIKVSEPGGAHGYSALSYEFNGRISHKDKEISVSSSAGKRPGDERFDYVVSLLKMDYPGYAIWFFPSALGTATRIEGRIARNLQLGGPRESFEYTVHGLPSNKDSIAATLTNYKILPGITRIPMAKFDASFETNYYAADDRRRVDRLKEEMGTSGQVSPLIAVKDAKGYYILEGGHRLVALFELGASDIPALVVLDLDEVEEEQPETESFESRIEGLSSFASLLEAPQPEQIASLAKLLLKGGKRPGLSVEDMIRYVTEIGRNADPLPNWEHGRWLLKLWKKSLKTNREQGQDLENEGVRQRIHNLLVKFVRAKNANALTGDAADINQYKTVNDLEVVLDALPEEAFVSKRALKRGKVEDRFNFPGSETVAESDRVKVVKVTTPEAAAIHAEHTDWCTADTRAAEGYLKHGPLYVVYTLPATKVVAAGYEVKKDWEPLFQTSFNASEANFTDNESLDDKWLEVAVLNGQEWADEVAKTLRLALADEQADFEGLVSMMEEINVIAAEFGGDVEDGKIKLDQLDSSASNDPLVYGNAKAFLDEFSNVAEDVAYKYGYQTPRPEVVIPMENLYGWGEGTEKVLQALREIKAGTWEPGMEAADEITSDMEAEALSSYYAREVGEAVPGKIDEWFEDELITDDQHEELMQAWEHDQPYWELTQDLMEKAYEAGGKWDFDLESGASFSETPEQMLDRLTPEQLGKHLGIWKEYTGLQQEPAGQQTVLPKEGPFTQDIRQRIARNLQLGGPRESFESMVEDTTDVTYHNMHIDTIGGPKQYEHKYQIKAETPDRVVGILEYTVFEGTVHIDWIEVAEDVRRQGIGRGMLAELEQQNPGVEIQWGMTTPEGTKLRRASAGESFESMVEADAAQAQPGMTYTPVEFSTKHQWVTEQMIRDVMARHGVIVMEIDDIPKEPSKNVPRELYQLIQRFKKLKGEDDDGLSWHVKALVPDEPEDLVWDVPEVVNEAFGLTSWAISPRGWADWAPIELVGREPWYTTESFNSVVEKKMAQKLIGRGPGQGVGNAFDKGKPAKVVKQVRELMKRFPKDNPEFFWNDFEGTLLMSRGDWENEDNGFPSCDEIKEVVKELVKEAGEFNIEYESGPPRDEKEKWIKLEWRGKDDGYKGEEKDESLKEDKYSFPLGWLLPDGGFIPIGGRGYTHAYIALEQLIDSGEAVPPEDTQDQDAWIDAEAYAFDEVILRKNWIRLSSDSVDAGVGGVSLAGDMPGKMEQVRRYLKETGAYVDVVVLETYDGHRWHRYTIPFDRFMKLRGTATIAQWAKKGTESMPSFADLVERRRALQTIVFHGTSSTFLPKIMSQGLIPIEDPEKKSWGYDPTATFMSVSRASIGGTYLTDNLMTASSAAGRAMHKFGGDEVIIVAQVSLGSAYMDEDDLTFWLKAAIPGREDSELNVAELYIQEALFPESTDSRRLKMEFKETFLEAMKRKIGELWDPELEGRLRQLLEDYYRVVLARFAAYVDDLTFKRAVSYDARASKQYDWETALQLRPDKEQAEAGWRAMLDQLTRTFGLLGVGKSFALTMRMAEPIGFTGRNRIIAIYREERGITSQFSTDFVRLYGTEDPSEMVEQMKTKFGPSSNIYSPEQVQQMQQDKERFGPAVPETESLASFADLVEQRVPPSSTEEPAVEEFGITTDPREAGYILSDGRMLDFSGKREGGSPGARAYDHREIGCVIGAGGTEGMDEFMYKTGAIRVHPETGDLHLVKLPTSGQRAAIRSWVDHFADEDPTHVEVMPDPVDPHRSDHRDFGLGVSAKKVIFGIRRMFRGLESVPSFSSLVESDWRELGPSEDEGDPNALLEELEAIYELEYKYSRIETGEWVGTEDKEKILAGMEEAFRETAESICEKLSGVFSEWLEKHALMDPRKWAASYAEGYFEEGFDPRGVLELIAGEMDEGRWEMPGFETAIRGHFDDLSQLEALAQQLLDEDRQSWEADEHGEDEEYPYEDAELKDFFFDYASSWGGFGEFIDSMPVDEQMLLEIIEKAVHPYWAEYWRERGIEETRETIESAYEEMASIAGGSEEWSMKELKARVNYFVQITHQTGPILDYVNEHWDLSVGDLTALSQRNTDDWDQELAQMGVVVPGKEVHEPFRRDIRQRMAKTLKYGGPREAISGPRITSRTDNAGPEGYDVWSVVFPGGDRWAYAVGPGLREKIGKLMRNQGRAVALLKRVGKPVDPQTFEPLAVQASESLTAGAQMAIDVCLSNDVPLEKVVEALASLESSTVTLEESPKIDTLKKNRVKLTDEERDKVMKSKAVWHFNGEDKPSPAVSKAVVNGKTWYWSATHRAYQVRPTLDGAIKVYHDFIAGTA